MNSLWRGPRIQALARRGHKPAAIARRLGLHPATVRKILAQAGAVQLHAQ
ncbi:MAG TPA: helix-turn-helix domain-containing protein [Chthoniobacterales bacterium]